MDYLKKNEMKCKTFGISFTDEKQSDLTRISQLQAGSEKPIPIH
jgi:hypothetical protein